MFCHWFLTLFFLKTWISRITQNKIATWQTWNHSCDLDDGTKLLPTLASFSHSKKRVIPDQEHKQTAEYECGNEVGIGKLGVDKERREIGQVRAIRMCCL